MTKRVMFACCILVLMLPVIVQSAVPLWISEYNRSHYSDPAGVAVDNQDNIFMVGRSPNGVNGCLLTTVKYLPNGDTAWARTYLGNFTAIDITVFGFGVIADNFGNSYVRATGWGVGTARDLVVVKYLPNGDTAWVRTYNNPDNGDDIISGIAADASSNVYVTGFSLRPNSLYEFVTIKYLPNGDTDWMRFYQTPDSLPGYVDAITMDGAGNVYVAGRFGYESIPDGRTTIVVIEYNAAGDVVNTWTRYEDRLIYIYKVCVDNAGDVVVAGDAYNGATAYDFFTMKFGASGEFLWERDFDCGSSRDNVRDIAVPMHQIISMSRDVRRKSGWFAHLHPKILSRRNSRLDSPVRFVGEHPRIRQGHGVG